VVRSNPFSKFQPKSMKKPAADMDSFIIGFPAETQVLLSQIRATIRKAAPRATEKISYGIPTFEQEGNLVHFSGYKNHIGFYPGTGAIAAFKAEISVYKNAKGTVQFPLDQPLPLGLIRRIVQFRVKQNLAKAASKKKTAAIKNK
jgi:uncharacterized protein YdhG (YjbR/CyaY superfamily)